MPIDNSFYLLDELTHIESRMIDIVDAIERLKQHEDRETPKEWNNEYNRLAKRVQEIRESRINQQ